MVLLLCQTCWTQIKPNIGQTLSGSKLFANAVNEDGMTPDLLIIADHFCLGCTFRYSLLMDLVDLGNFVSDFDIVQRNIFV